MSALLQLACFQILIYAGMWAAGWVILGEERKAVLHWLGFNLLLALGLGLVSLRPAGDPWFTVVLANLVLAGGFLLLYRGGALFLRLPVRDGELAAAMLGCIAFALWSGPIPHGPGWIHPGAGTAALIGWTLLAGSWRGRAALTAQFGARTAWVALSPQVLYGLVQVLRAHQIITLDATAVQLQTHSAANELLVYASMLSAAVFNLVFMFLIVLRLMGRLTYMVDHDALTGLFNRRAIQAMLEREWARWRRMGKPFTVIALDLDHFKQINDRWGHPAGDEVLRQTAGRLQGQVREIDAVGRVGGEEFLVLMPGCSAGDAPAVAQRLHQALRNTPVEVDSQAQLQVTASLGVAVVGVGDATVDKLLARADLALYRAKHGGRDRVEFDHPPAAAEVAARQDALA